MSREPMDDVESGRLPLELEKSFAVLVERPIEDVDEVGAPFEKKKSLSMLSRLWLLNSVTLSSSVLASETRDDAGLNPGLP